MVKPLPQRMLLGGDIHTAEWLTHSEGGQRLLAAHHNSPLRPRCQCVASGVDMSIAQRDGRFYLARLPGSGFLHDGNCPSVETVNPYSGSSCYSRHALFQNTDGEVNVVYSPGVSRCRHNMPAVGIDGLLDLLIEGANLNAWRPADDPRRSWREVREALAHATSEIHLDAFGPLTQQLMLPSFFEKESYPVLQFQQETFLSETDALRFVCAPVRVVAQSPYGWHIGLKHLPRTNFWLSREEGEVLAGSAGGIDPLANPPETALVLAQVKPARQAHNFNIVHLAMRRVDARFMPCLSDAESQAAGALVERGVPFHRPLRFDAPWDYPLADFALRYADTVRLAYVPDPTGLVEVDAAKRATLSVLASNGILASIWENHEWLNLPVRLSTNSVDK